MINGAHAVLYSDDALPPAELAVHPAEEGGRAELYLMTDDVAATVTALRAEGIEVTPISDQGWGLLTAIALPGGVELGLYQPRHRPRPSRAEHTARSEVRTGGQADPLRIIGYTT
jgi:hypothetical protein